MLSSKSPLSSSIQDRDRVRSLRDRFAPFESDLLLLVPIFNKFEEVVRKSGGPFSRAARDFCRQHCLYLDAMNTAFRIRQQFVTYLKSAGLVDKSTRQTTNAKSEGNGRFGLASQFCDDLVSCITHACALPPVGTSSNGGNLLISM